MSRLELQTIHRQQSVFKSRRRPLTIERIVGAYDLLLSSLPPHACADRTSELRFWMLWYSEYDDIEVENVDRWILLGRYTYQLIIPHTEVKQIRSWFYQWCEGAEYQRWMRMRSKTWTNNIQDTRRKFHRDMELKLKYLSLLRGSTEFDCPSD